METPTTSGVAVLDRAGDGGLEGSPSVVVPLESHTATKGIETQCSTSLSARRPWYKKCLPDVKKYPKELVLVFILTYICYASVYFVRKPVSIVKSELQDELHVSTDALGMIDTTFLIGYAVGQFLMSSLGDIYGIRKTLFFIFFSAALFCASFGFVGIDVRGEGAPYVAPVMCTLWALNGLVQGGAFPISLKLFSAYLVGRNDQGTMIGWWVSCQQIGGVLSAAIAGAVMNVRALGKWRAAFFIPAIWVALLAVLIVLVVKDPKPQMKSRMVPTEEQKSAAGETPVTTPSSTSSLKLRRLREVDGEQSPKEEKEVQHIARQDSVISRRSKKGSDVDLDHSIKTAEDVFKDDEEEQEKLMIWELVCKAPALINYGMAYFCVKLVRYAMMLWLPYYATTALGYSPSNSAYFSIIFDVGGIVGCIAGGYISDKFFQGKWTLMVAIFCTIDGVLGFFYYQLSQNVVLHIIVMTIYGICISGPDSLLAAVGPNEACERAGTLNSVATAAGIVNGMGSIGTIVQGVMTSQMTTRLGWNPFFCILGAFCLFSVIMLIPSLYRDIKEIRKSARDAKNPEANAQLTSVCAAPAVAVVEGENRMLPHQSEEV